MTRKLLMYAEKPSHKLSRFHVDIWDCWAGAQCLQTKQNGPPPAGEGTMYSEGEAKQPRAERWSSFGCLKKFSVTPLPAGGNKKPDAPHRNAVFGEEESSLGLTPSFLHSWWKFTFKTVGGEHTARKQGEVSLKCFSGQRSAFRWEENPTLVAESGTEKKLYVQKNTII